MSQKTHGKAEEEKAKLSPYLKKQLGCNNACKKTMFSNMIILFWVFLPCSHRMYFHECLDIGKRSYKLNSNQL